MQMQKFISNLARCALRVLASLTVLAGLVVALLIHRPEALVGVLAQDPRPRYQDDPEREYGMAFGEMNVRFTVAGETLTVTGIERKREK